MPSAENSCARACDRRLPCARLRAPQTAATATFPIDQRKHTRAPRRSCARKTVNFPSESALFESRHERDGRRVLVMRQGCSLRIPGTHVRARKQQLPRGARELRRGLRLLLPDAALPSPASSSEPARERERAEITQTNLFPESALPSSSKKRKVREVAEVRENVGNGHFKLCE